MNLKRFNIRVYGLLINDNNEVLLSDENRFGKQFTKFPGGGLEFGEGTKECLLREFKEELNLDVEIGELFYLTDFFQESAFNANDQLISIYYKVICKDCYDIETTSIKFKFNDKEEVHRWIQLSELSIDDLTFPIDKLVANLLQGV